MNVDGIYQLQRDDAFASQFQATEYQTFAAMPFSNRGGYPEGRIYDLVKRVHEEANKLLPGDSKRHFAELQRIDEITSGTVTITDAIIRQILSCHFFWGDLTGCNFGVVLETGLALALKPNDRVLLYTQDGTHSLHFDLAVTRITPYQESDLLGTLAKDLVRAAECFEAEADRYIRLVSSQLTSDAIFVLNIYGRLWKDRSDSSLTPSLFHRIAKQYMKHFAGSSGRILFNDAVRELSAKRLMWTDYQTNTSPGYDSYGLHATKLGWRVIEHLWKHDRKMREPENAITGPNA
ncbi:MAG: hypothetical protein IPK92_06055 [Nitrospira sp.]|jgi:hypothetical protein|nr:hypothetical protein [Nitrospira sp.]MBL8054557.1 hypothetical protein [Nitrospira sp.]